MAKDEITKEIIATLSNEILCDELDKQKKELIDKACEWLEMHVEYWAYEDGYFDVSAMLADFRKAMEE